METFSLLFFFGGLLQLQLRASGLKKRTHTHQLLSFCAGEARSSRAHLRNMTEVALTAKEADVFWVLFGSILVILMQVSRMM